MTHPKITLAGVEYEIPPLAIKQNRHVEVLAARHLAYFASARDRSGRVNLLDITEEQAEDFQRIVYHAITRTRPELTLEAFEDLPISMLEIMAALPVCLNQSGLFRPATEAAPPTGEATPPSTGDGLIAEFSVCLGQTWDYVEDTLTMAQITAYRKYFARHPPVHLLAAAYMGYKPPVEQPHGAPPATPAGRRGMR